MGLAVWAGNKRFEIGAASFLKALFSTIYLRLEGGRWGERYPVFMREFYSGRLSPEDVPSALEELAEIALEFQHLKAEEVVWDFENLQRPAPWVAEDDYDPAVPARAYLLTSDGRDVFDVLGEAFHTAATLKRELMIT